MPVFKNTYDVDHRPRGKARAVHSALGCLRAEHDALEERARGLHALLVALLLPVRGGGWLSRTPVDCSPRVVAGALRQHHCALCACSAAVVPLIPRK